jgi:hypothetical protein
MRHLNEAGLTLVFKRLVDLHPHIPSSPHFFIYIYIIGGVVWQTGSEREEYLLARAILARAILVGIAARGILVILVILDVSSQREEYLLARGILVGIAARGILVYLLY